MTFFRALMIAFFISIVLYTINVGYTDGWDLFSVFIENLTALNWSGQFNLDFMTYLSLSGLWLAWRHDFSWGGIALAVLAAIGGILVFAPYLFFASLTAKGNMKILLLGERRAFS
jgi:hypothetical protein